jgi:hypothetical protein
MLRRDGQAWRGCHLARLGCEAGELAAGVQRGGRWPVCWSRASSSCLASRSSEAVMVFIIRGPDGEGKWVFTPSPAESARRGDPSLASLATVPRYLDPVPGPAEVSHDLLTAAPGDWMHLDQEARDATQNRWGGRENDLVLGALDVHLDERDGVELLDQRRQRRHRHQLGNGRRGQLRNQSVTPVLVAVMQGRRPGTTRESHPAALDIRQLVESDVGR